ncbi:MAG TPA: HlyC/CorC family transporter [Firmicutes bacterium]|jgi:putative hemolysin|nr:HlyC/CorC family transporter [Bacillota bacterium]
MIWVTLGLLLVGSSLFRTCETAFLYADRSSLRYADTAEKSGRYADMWRKPGRLAATTLLGGVVVNTTFTVLITLTALERYGRYAAIVAVMFAALLILAIGEVFPRVVGSVKAQQISLWALRPLQLLSVLLQPFVHMVLTGNRLITRLLGGPQEPVVMVTTADIRSLISLGHEQGVLEHEEEEMLTSVFEFRDAVAGEVMTPRLDLPLVPVTAGIDEAADCMLQQGVSRLAAYESHPDQIIGVVHIEDVLRAKMDGRDCLVHELARPALVVPESKSVADLLNQMRKTRVSTAIVADEYGSSSGVITLEDLVEHIVGDLWDEHDPDHAEDGFISGESGGVVDGRLSIDELNDALNIRLSDEHAHTLGGWIFHTLGRLAQQGDSVTYADVEFKVVAMDRWRVDKVRVTHLPGKDHVPMV